MIDWSIQKARDTYNIAHWSGGYFDINAKGHLVCRPDARAEHPGIDMFELSRGIQAGSKPELLAVLALSRQDGGVVVCNGYKDREYIRLALIGKEPGHRVYIVVEKPTELELVIKESSALGITPLIGLRMRLASIGAGKWQNTGGDKSKFGLSASQVLDAIARRRATTPSSAPTARISRCSTSAAGWAWIMKARARAVSAP